jgi:hypothetical protein
MSEGFYPISDDGQRMITVAAAGYSLYHVNGEIDPTADVRLFRWCGFVPEFIYAEQWLRDGQILGEVLQVPVTPQPRPVKGSRGQSPQL